jgi:hypothetical protein
MIYSDRVYGKVEISEPVVLELIKSPAIERLKGIDQAGYRPLWVKTDVKLKNRYDNSRFSHSVGVYILLKKYGASLEEQIAGLIHDISHAAFSHCIDYVLEEGSEKEHNHQDNIFEKFVRKTEIPGILKKYNFNIEYVLNDMNFPLKEKPLPDLCADRLDYSLRTAVIFEVINEKELNYFLNNLGVKNKRWVFRNFYSAKKYAELFFKLNNNYYAGIKSAVMFRAVGDCLRYALEKKYISALDLYTTDEEVIKKIKRNLNKDRNLKLFFQRMDGQIKIRNNQKNYDARVFCKSRIVDPLCEHGGKIKRISEIDKKWAEVVKKESQPKEYFLKFAK